jgi:hypothetical protein
MPATCWCQRNSLPAVLEQKNEDWVLAELTVEDSIPSGLTIFESISVVRDSYREEQRLKPLAATSTLAEHTQHSR